MVMIKIEKHNKHTINRNKPQNTPLNPTTNNPNTKNPNNNIP
jgi:hypothetical protein